MAWRSIIPNININTASPQLRTELQNTFSRMDSQLSAVPFTQFSTTSAVSNSGAAETDLITSVIEQGTLGQLGAGLLIYAAGNTGANANNKTLKLVLGSTTLFTSGALALNNIDWSFWAIILFNGGSSQVSTGTFSRNGGNDVVQTTTGSESFASNLTLKLTGTGTASGDIALSFWKGLLLN